MAPKAAAKPPLDLRAIYTMQEAANVIGLSFNTVQRKVKAGRFPHCRVGRRVIIRGDQIAAFLRNNEAKEAA